MLVLIPLCKIENNLSFTVQATKVEEKKEENSPSQFLWENTDQPH